MRHPSNSNDPGVGPSGPVAETDEQAGRDDDEEDRRTISGVPRDLDAIEAKSRNRDGGVLALNVQNGGDEKLRHENRGDNPMLSLDPSIHS